jgi:hypothetical protein
MAKSPYPKVPTNDRDIRLGQIVRDRVTNFSGTATSRVEYIAGCVHYCVQPPVGKDGKAGDCQYLDWQRLEITGEGIALPTRDTGGPAPAPAGHAHP